MKKQKIRTSKIHISWHVIPLSRLFGLVVAAVIVASASDH